MRSYITVLQYTGALSIHGVNFPDVASFDNRRRTLGPEVLLKTIHKTVDDLNIRYYKVKINLGPSLEHTSSRIMTLASTVFKNIKFFEKKMSIYMH